MITQTLPTVTTESAFLQSPAHVKAAQHLIGDSGLVIPKGTPGHVLEYIPAGNVIIDFGAMPVFRLPIWSPLIEWGASR